MPTTWHLTHGWRRCGPIAADLRPGPIEAGRHRTDNQSAPSRTTVRISPDARRSGAAHASRALQAIDLTLQLEQLGRDRDRGGGVAGNRGAQHLGERVHARAVRDVGISIASAWLASKLARAVGANHTPWARQRCRPQTACVPRMIGAPHPTHGSGAGAAAQRRRVSPSRSSASPQRASTTAALAHSPQPAGHPASPSPGSSGAAHTGHAALPA